MRCTFTPEKLEEVVAFHGHSCPGLTIGIRAAELAAKELGPPEETDLVTVSETDMCGVDAIQYLTGCTLGKGNLILRDFGKMAFTFYDRKSSRSLRAILRDDVRGEMGTELSALMQKIAQATATPEEHARSAQLRGKLIDRFLDLDLQEMFTLQWLEAQPPRSPRVLDSLSCEACGEKTMESRTRRFDGKILCIPCFEKVEQKK